MYNKASLETADHLLHQAACLTRTWNQFSQTIEWNWHTFSTKFVIFTQERIYIFVIKERKAGCTKQGSLNKDVPNNGESHIPFWRTYSFKVFKSSKASYIAIEFCRSGRLDEFCIRQFECWQQLSFLSQHVFLMVTVHPASGGEKKRITFNFEMVAFKLNLQNI